MVPKTDGSGALSFKSQKRTLRSQDRRLYLTKMHNIQILMSSQSQPLSSQPCEMNILLSASVPAFPKCFPPFKY